MNFKFEAVDSKPNDADGRKTRTYDLGDGSEVMYVPRFLPFDDSWKWFRYLDKEIPWSRPILHVFGRSSIQRRDICYVANKGLQGVTYSGHQPKAYSWDDFPPLADILNAVQEALPGSKFNSLVLNRYKGGDDYVSWHSDDDKLYGPTPEIASVSFGCDRQFLLKKKPRKRVKCEPGTKQLKKSNRSVLQHSFMLKHGSLFVMRGYTQRDWLHSIPKRAKAEATRINLTFRRVF